MIKCVDPEANHKHNGKHAVYGSVPSAINTCFRACAHKVAMVLGSPWAFLVALLIIIVWGVTGPIFQYSDTWQLIINTGTTIVTFLMVFLIQNTQNRDSKALQLKLDELILAVKSASNQMVAIENLSDEELDHLQEQFERLREKAAEQQMDALHEHADLTIKAAEEEKQEREEERRPETEHVRA